MMKNVSLTLASLLLLCTAWFGFGTAAANPAPALDIPFPGPPPCFCLASYTITKSLDCDCDLQIVDLSWLASPNCAQFGNPNCPEDSNKRCELFASFEEVGDCAGSWPNMRIRARCARSRTVNLDCSGGGVHKVKLTCAPCQLI